jgi:NAD(P)-dependent dehydrogenase (short-subunit alcohol dehydrogenase family)
MRSESMGKLDGKVAVITGGSSGIGEATVKLFVEEGCRVVIADVQDDKGKALKNSLGASTVFVHTDVTLENDVKAAVNRALSSFGTLDCMFNNAGTGQDFIPIEETDYMQFQRIVAINLGGVFLGMKYAAPVMKHQGGGSIINIACAALWLATDDSSFVNGASIVVQGGMTCGSQWTNTIESSKGLESRFPGSR